MDWLVCPSYKERLVGDLWETAKAREDVGGRDAEPATPGESLSPELSASKSSFTENACPSEKAGPIESRSS